MDDVKGILVDSCLRRSVGGADKDHVIYISDASLPDVGQARNPAYGGMTKQAPNAPLLL